MSISSILRYASRLLWLTALFSTFPIYAASSNHPGGMTGTLTSGSAEVISTGNIRYFGIVGRDDFYDPSSGDSERESRLLTGVTFGLSSHLEMGVGVSFAHGTSPIATGTELRYLRGHAKYVFYGSRARGSAAAVSIYSTTAELPDNLGLTSGNANSGLELIYSQLGLEGDTTYALGLEHRDYKTYNTGTFTYSDVPVLSLSASHLFRTELKRNYELGLKTESASVGNTEYGNIYLNVAAHFATDQELSYLVGTMMDLQGGEGPNHARYYLGFTYTSKHPSRLGQRPGAKSALSKIPTPITPTLAQTEALSKNKMDVPRTKGCLAQVEIMDLSGISGLADIVSGKLKKDGYCIRAIHREANSHAYYSHLYYGLDKGEMAVSMARAYKIQGEVSRRRLPSDVDIRFILGKDQR